MKLRLAFVALAPLLSACASDRLTGVAAARGLAPASIASIAVVKGAAATTVYGERGNRGVILITSKSTSGGAAR